MNTSLEKVTTEIVKNAEIIREYQKLSRQETGPHLLPPTAPDSVHRARQLLLQASMELQQICSEPSEYLDQAQIHYQQLSALQWLIHFNILQQIPVGPDASIAYTELATAAKVSLKRLKSVARMAMTGGILTEPRPEYVAHSRISAQFVTEPAFIDWALFMTRYSAPMALGFSEATERWGGDTVAKDQTAYNVAFNTPLSFFEHVSQSKDLTKHFAGYMRGLGQSSGLAMEHLLGGFDWASLGTAHVVDVGGSTGQIDIMLATHFPKLTFTVEDLPATIAGVTLSSSSSLDPSIASRIAFKAHDFMQPQPDDIAASADVYLLRKILHDWSTADARVILQNLVLSMAKKPGARIVVMDSILPPPGTVSALQEASLRVRDLTMAQSFNSNERERSDWLELFASTTPPLRLKRECQPLGSVMAVMELVRDE